MTKKNRELLFDNDEEVIITLTDEETGKDFDCEIIACLELEELKKEFIALMPTETPDDMDEGEALIVEYSEDKDGNPEFSPLEDDDLFQVVSEAFNEFFANVDVDEDGEINVNGDDLKVDINDVLPDGVSIK